MSDATRDQQEPLEKAWRLLDIQADAMPKLVQSKTEAWKVVVAGMAAGDALVARLRVQHG